MDTTAIIPMEIEKDIMIMIILGGMRIEIGMDTILESMGIKIGMDTILRD